MARSTPSAERVIAECKRINPKGKYRVIKVDLSSVRQTDMACQKVIEGEKENGVNLLVLSAGEIRFDRQVTEEGLHLFLTTAYYTRMQIASTLLPLLQTASLHSPLARILDVAGGTKEGYIDTSDLPALHLPLRKLRGHLTSMHTLALETLAKQAPTVSFVHDFPGSVATPLFDGIPGLSGFVYKVIATIFKVFLGRWVCVPIEECGERHVYLGTSARYAPEEGNSAGLSPGAVGIGIGSDGLQGSGVYIVDWDCEGPGASAKLVLEGLRKKGVSEVVWEHTVGELNRIKAGIVVKRWR